MTDDPSAPRVALTFEAGGDPIVVGQVLDVLRDTRTSATIFLDGAWSARYPDLVRRMAAEGHELGNHAYNHPDLTGLDDNTVREELSRTDQLARELTGQPAHPWLRPPYGTFDDRIRKLAAADGYRIVQRFAVDGAHWPGETTPDSVLNRSLDLSRDGAVIAYHLNSPITLQVLPAIIERLQAEGYEFVRLSDLPGVSERDE
jgi:peptidoglycan-N-acetylglucosamine deacetylase